MPYYGIFIVCSEIRALPLRSGNESVILILIQIYHAGIAFIIFVINIIDTRVTIACHGSSLLFNMDMSIDLSLADASVLCHLFHGAFFIHSAGHVKVHMLLYGHVFPGRDLLLF